MPLMIMSANCSTCEGCRSHFRDLRGSLKSVKTGKRFLKDMEQTDEAVRRILNCENTDIATLHKFEKKIEGNFVFRGLIDKTHVLYAVTEARDIVFLRAFRNEKLYRSYLEDTAGLKKAFSSFRSD